MENNIDEYVSSQRQKLAKRKSRLVTQADIEENTKDSSEREEFPTVSNDAKFLNRFNINLEGDYVQKLNLSDLPNSDRSARPYVDSPQSDDPNFRGYSGASSPNSKKLGQANPFQFYDDFMKRNLETRSDHSAESGRHSALSKADKDSANRKEIRPTATKRKTRRTQDEMEQWVSDTFYSYFPSFNKEEQKRENLARDRHLEYQNYLKKISEEGNNAKNSSIEHHTEGKRYTPKPDKTDLEIIVNNPSYSNEKNKNDLPRPNSTRHKLLEDLTHTDLSNLINSNAIQERNKRSTELEVQKKREYQQELLRQIEEKQKEITILKEKEKKEEERLNRKIKEQMEEMRINEEMEREQQRINRARLKQQQNEAVQAHLSHLASDNKSRSANGERHTVSENDKEPPNKNNKVYKYFSNSARHYDYRKLSRDNLFESFEVQGRNPLPSNEMPLEKQKTLNGRCSHLNKVVCPFCDIKLKSYESWCRKCQQQVLDDGAENRLMLCENCEKQFLICAACEKQSILCNFCHHKRNACLHCIANYCIHCGKSVKIPKITHSSRTSVSGNRSKPNSERSFQILELSYPENEKEQDPDEDGALSDNGHSLPYSVNIPKNSIFHPNHSYKERKKEEDFNETNELASSFWEEKEISEIKEEANSRLNKYLQNYGDLAVRNSRSRATQTSRESTPQLEEEYPSMPLLREIPRRKLSDRSEHNQHSDKMSSLSRKWEIPAVQRLTISNSSPRVLTQIGAFRKQLQAEEFEELDK